MTTLTLRASDVQDVPQVWSGLARVGAFIVTVLDVFAEARLQAIAAHRRLSVR